jgi:hypothetical protein
MKQFQFSRSSRQFSSRQLTTRNPQLRTSRQVTGLCVISCEMNRPKCSSANERPNKQSDKQVSLLITDALLGNMSHYKTRVAKIILI